MGGKDTCMKVTFEKATELLQAGQLVAIPTETVYGLAACYEQAEAVARIFALKGRPTHNPLILHIASVEQLYPFLSQIPDMLPLLTALWPAPLTLVLPVHKEKVPFAVRAGLSTQAFRLPAHPVTRALLAKTGPLVAPSANLSTRPSSTTADHVEEDFGELLPVLDAGPCSEGVESTILIYQEGKWYLGRQGAMAQEPLEALLGYPLTSPTGQQIRCPGQQLKHYAPKATLYLVKQPNHVPVVVGFSDRDYGVTRLFSLGSSQNPEQAAYRLYDQLRALDRASIAEAWVDIDFPQTGLWRTILERLNKAGGG